MSDASILVYKKDVIKCLKEYSDDDYKEQNIGKLIGNLYKLPKARLSQSPCDDYVRVSDVVFVIKYHAHETLGSLIEAIENNHEHAISSGNQKDGFYTGYSMAYDEVRELIPDCVYEKVSDEYVANQWLSESLILQGCIEELVNLSHADEMTWVKAHYELDGEEL